MTRPARKPRKSMTPYIDRLMPDEDCDKWDMESGMPSVMNFANAIQVWSIAQNREVDVNEAATTFNVNPTLIRQAVEAHRWMLLIGDKIEHEGE